MTHFGSSRPLVKRAAAVAAAVFALGPVLGTLHLGLVPHVLCPEHGELVDLDEATPAVAVDLPRRSAVIERATGTAAGHAHHHCEVVARRVAPSIRGQASPDAPPVSDVAGSCNECGMQAHRIDILRLAPKASPPDAA